MSAHTPGPWRLSNESPKIVMQDLQMIGGGCGTLIGSAAGHPNSGFFPSEEEGLANARLIAAAPDLLAALEEAHKLLRLCGPEANEFGLVDQVAAAIARATGATP